MTIAFGEHSHISVTRVLLTANLGPAAVDALSQHLVHRRSTSKSKDHMISNEAARKLIIYNCVQNMPGRAANLLWVVL